MEILKKIQNKPEPIKKKIMWFFVGFFMLGVVIIWIFSMPKLSFKTPQELENLTHDIQDKIDESEIIPKQEFKLPLEL